jgi:hypothetical protein
VADEHGTAQDDVGVIREALSYYDLDCPWTDKEEQRSKILRARQALDRLAALAADAPAPEETP